MNSKTVLKAIVMAGGKGTRLKSTLPKVLHPLFDKPLLQHVLDNLAQAVGNETLDEVFVITGHASEQVQAAINTWSYPFRLTAVLQNPQMGTGHAVQQVLPYLPAETDCRVLILSGDVPLLRAATLSSLSEQTADLTAVVAELQHPAGYGRVLASLQGGFHIVEEKDCSPVQHEIRTVNAGLYQCQWSRIAPLLHQLDNNNVQQEYYLTDLLRLASNQGLQVNTQVLDDAAEMLGVNSRADLAACHQQLRKRNNAYWLAEGVTIIDPDTTWIGPDVQLSPDVTLYPGCWLSGHIQVDAGCVLGPYSIIKGPAIIGRDSQVGPFAHLRDGVTLAEHVRIGNFVELKNTQIAAHTNAAHLAYLGDAVLGQHVNIGAGTITANYDPIRQVKSPTHIADGVKVGSNSVLVAPVTLHERVSIAAGSVITEDVSAGSLAIARPRQTELTGWVDKKLEQRFKNPDG